MKAKRIITIALIAVIAMTATFADTSHKVSVQGNVAEVAANLKLTYNGSEINGDTDIYSDAQTKTKYNLKLNGNTQKFELKFWECNYNTTKTFTCTVTPAPFKGMVDGKEVEANVVTLDNEVSNLTVKAGPQKDVVLKSFNLKWDGDSNIAAGDYVSDVTITYGIL
jgi:hypothetical protein